MSARPGRSPVSLAKRAAGLKGVIKPDMLADLLELLQQDVDLTAWPRHPGLKTIIAAVMEVSSSV